ncbi:hypothetical protein BDR05DRAFT_967045 [Suillus weaverae]|nr:hypothetical protein BDR05DRAFT_967045 [Suillus weaverae]
MPTTMNNIVQHIKARCIPTNPSDLFDPISHPPQNAFLLPVCSCPRRCCYFGIINLCRDPPSHQEVSRLMQ